MPKRIHYQLDTEEFGKRLRFLRERRGLDGKEFAEMSEIDYRTYMAYEVGQRAVLPMEDMAKIARTHGLSLDELGGIAGIMPTAGKLEQRTPDVIAALKRWVPLVAGLEPVRRQALYTLFEGMIGVVRTLPLPESAVSETLPDWLAEVEFDPFREDSEKAG